MLSVPALCGDGLFGPAALYPKPSVLDTLGTVKTESNDDGRSRRWDAHRAARRRELVKAAIGAIDELGPQASMEDIAAAAGTSKSVFYRYFEDKAGLQEAVADRVLRRVRRELVAAVEDGEHALDALRRMLGAYLQLIERSPNTYAYITQDFSSDEIRGFFKTVTELMSQSLAEVLGDAEQTSASEREAVLAYWPHASVGLVRSAAETWLYSPPASRPSLAEMRDLITGWLAYGLAPSASLPTSPSSHRTTETS